jgi:hypothetical protein
MSPDAIQADGLLVRKQQRQLEIHLPRFRLNFLVRLDISRNSEPAFWSSVCVRKLEYRPWEDFEKICGTTI